MKEAKYVFFDFDGTLVDSMPMLFKVYLEFLKKYYISGSREEFDKLIGPTIPEIVRILKEKYSIQESYEKLLEEYEWKIKNSYEKVGFEDTGKILKKLEQNRKKLALVTSSLEKYIGELIKKAGWDEYFKFMIFGNEVKKTKPDSEIYLLALKKAGCKPEEAIVVEDSKNGVAAAKSAGIPVIAVNKNREYRKKLKEKGADIVIGNLAGILDVLIQNGDREI